MACSGCALKAAAQGARMVKQVPVVMPTDCLYTLAELEEKLTLATLNKEYDQVGMLKSAINMYSKNCNMFNNYIK